MHALGREPVDIGRFTDGTSVAGKRVVGEVVGNDEQHVHLVGGHDRWCEQEEAADGEYEQSCHGEAPSSSNCVSGVFLFRSGTKIKWSSGVVNQAHKVIKGPIYLTNLFRFKSDPKCLTGIFDQII